MRKTKMDKAMATLMAMVADSGVEIDEAELNIPRRNYRSNDAVVIFAHLPAHFKPGVCKECGKPYAVNKRFVGYCSDPCRDENWRRTTGLEPYVVKIRDVWDGDPPMIVTPDQFQKLKAIAEWFTLNETALQEEAKKLGFASEESQEDFEEEDLQFPIQETFQVDSDEKTEALDEPHTIPVSSLNLSEPIQILPEVKPFELT